MEERVNITGHWLCLWKLVTVIVEWN